MTGVLPMPAGLDAIEIRVDDEADGLICLLGRLVGAERTSRAGGRAAEQKLLYRFSSRHQK